MVFIMTWYNKFSWLEYSVKKYAAFCFYCLQFTTPGDQSEMTQTFTEKGFRHLQRKINTKGCFAKHERSEQHKTSYLKQINFQKISKGKNVPFESRMCPGREQVITNNRVFLSSLQICYLHYSQ